MLAFALPTSLIDTTWAEAAPQASATSTTPTSTGNETPAAEPTPAPAPTPVSPPTGGSSVAPRPDPAPSPAPEAPAAPVPAVPATEPVEYLTLEEVGTLRELTDPDSPQTWDSTPFISKQDIERIHVPIDEPLPRFSASFAWPRFASPWAAPLLAAVLMAMALIPLLGLVARFVKRQPLFGCEIPALRTKACPI